MPEEDISCLPHKQLMQPVEIEEIAKIFISLGVRKIRLTGGEPLVRKEVRDITRRLSKLPVELTLTTNAVYADKYIDMLSDAGIKSLNVSLDTLRENRFFTLTRRDCFQQVVNNIQLLLAKGFHVKLNVVVMKGVNDDEIPNFVELTKHYALHVRFIEFMPFSGNQWEKEKVITAREMLETVLPEFDCIKLQDEKHATARKYQVINFPGTFAFITTMSAPFCSDCNRMRITADGKMKNCLFSKGETDLLSILRKGGDIIPLIRQNLLTKYPALGGQLAKNYKDTNGITIKNRSMIKIGG